MTKFLLLVVVGVFSVSAEKQSQFTRSEDVIPGETNNSTVVAPNSPRYLQRRATTVFYDDFSSGHIDPHKWRTEISADGVGNHEFQMYTPEHVNSYVKNGVLYLRPTLTVDRFGNDFLAHGTVDAAQIWGKCTNWDCHRSGWNDVHPIMSALLRSNGHIKYGKVEVVAQLPKGDWLWPAIWMMPVDNAYGGWPRSGEIDIMEACGNQHLTFHDGSSAGVDLDHATIHYGPGREGHKSHGQTYRIQGTTFGDGFHKYWLDWTEHYMKIGVDDHTVLTLNTPSNGFWNEGGFGGNNIWAHGAHNAPFDKPFYLILNVAVGGDFFWDGYVNHPYPKPWHHDDPNQMMEFWNARNKWLPTWHGEDVAMKIRSVKMQQY